VQFTPDGMRMFVINFNIANPATGGEIHEYALTNPWDLSGGVTYVKEHVFSSNVDSVKSFRFNNDGTKLFLSGWYQDGVTEGDIWEYHLTTPYDIGTIVEADPVVIDFYMGHDYFPTATFEFDTTGTILFMMYATDDHDVFQIRAISYQDPWDI